MIEIKVDLLIVGAGPAGMSAGLNANKNKINTLIIDRAVFPRDKVCGDAILMHDVSTIFEQLNIDFSKLIQSKSSSPVDFIISNVANHSFNLKHKTAIIKRFDLDNLLWNSLDDSNHVKKLDGAKINSFETTNTYHFLNFSIANQEYRIKTKYIIGADGYSSYIRRNYFGDMKFKNRSASRLYLKVSPEVNLKTSILFDKELSPGYFWFFKINETTYNTGIYQTEGDKNKIKDLHRTFIKRYFNVDIDLDEIKTWPIPSNVYLENLVKNNVVLTGDAAGLCDKLFGHGIDNAIMSGFIAVNSIIDAENSKIPYSLEEIYPYNLNSYIGKTLRDSHISYQLLSENYIHFEKIMNQINN